MRNVERVFNGISTVLAIIGTAAILVVMVAIGADVIKRELTGRSIVGVLELTEVLMVIFIFLGLAEAQRRDMHVQFGAVTAMLPPRVARYLEIVGALASIAYVGWMAYATLGRAIDSVQIREYRFGLIEVPIWPARIAIPLGLAALLLQLALHLYRLASPRAALEGGQVRPITDSF